MSQKEVGINVIALTAPFLNNKTGREFDVIDNVKYYRSVKKNKKQEEISDTYKSFGKRIKKFFQIFSFFRHVYLIVKKEKPNVIHAHAMFFCGIPALVVGRIFRIPVFYEVRSLWMLPKNNQYKSRFHKILTKILLKIEVFTMSLSKKVFVINQNLKANIEELGVKKEKLVIIKNAVNTTLVENNIAKIQQNNNKEELHFGYIGSITPYEGIPFFIKTIAEIEADFKFIIYGSARAYSDEFDKIDHLIKVLNLEDKVIFKGSIPPSEIYKAYKEIDVIVNPRLKNKITDTVTPLKPLEAMAYGKLFVGSDVGGIKDLLKGSDLGLIFESENKESLKKIILQVLSLSKNQIDDLTFAAMNFVREKNSWKQNALKYKEIYKTYSN
jgi:glycosyltransferase involved in cell wall biosynthesis